MVLTTWLGQLNQCRVGLFFIGFGLIWATPNAINIYGILIYWVGFNAQPRTKSAWIRIITGRMEGEGEIHAKSCKNHNSSHLLDIYCAPGTVLRISE